MTNPKTATTRLEGFIKEWGVRPGVFARKAGISRPHMRRLRNGLADPTRGVMCKLALAASELRGRRVFIDEMFELTESEWLAHNFLIIARVILTTLPLMSPDELAMFDPYARSE
jgi:transcriptional regulator with XRE-family HTH domain